MRRLEFPDIEAALRNEESYLKLGQSMEEAFPRFQDQKVTVGSQFSAPLSTMQAVVRWLWLASLAERSKSQIGPVLEAVIRRSQELCSIANGGYLRPEHDAFLMLASILSGNRILMERSADLVRVADPSSPSYQFFQAWTGILCARIKRQPAEEANQLEVLMRKRGLAAIHGPSHRLAKLFCARDYPKMEKLISQTIAAEWKSAETLGFVHPLETGDVTVLFRMRDPNHFWPWAEAGFAKLAAIEGFEVSPEQLWLPERLLRLD